jgi:putative DNA primase/helicase
VGHDFDGVARAALESAEFLLSQWMGGKRQGHEWVGERTSRGGIGDSWSVNLDTGTWKHFAGTESGADLIALYSELYRVSMNAARLEIIAQMGGHSEAPVLPMRAPRETIDRSRPAEPIPEDAPRLRDHPVHGAATAEYRYGNAFVVTRYDFINEHGEPDKVFVQWTWRAGKWTKQGFGPNRPLYELHTVIANPGVPVLVVEGEKCVHAATPLLPYYAVTTWSGGSQGWRQTDWSALKGREVMIWPDADDPGREAAAGIAAVVQPLAKRVRVINPNGAAVGWDVGDAIAEGWDSARVVEFMKAHCEAQVEGPKAEPEPGSTPHSELPSPLQRFEIPGKSPLVTLAALELECVKDVPVPSLANASKILQAHEIFKGHIWFDDFRGATYHTLRGPTPIRWTDAETRALTVNIQQQLKLPKFTSRIVEEGLQHAAECNRRNSLTAWLESLPVWDGTERLEMWLADCAGVEFNEYSSAVAANWLIGMVARAFQPGCKMDNMPVLEGISGLSKTSLLELLGGEWYKPLPMEFGSKDFLQALRGAWLVEIPDMTGFNRVAHSAVLATITIRNDTYRAPYGREPQEYPRTCVFAATSETDDYLSDMRGKRRYWPIRCTDINLDALRLSRDQLFAEALARYRDGARWYEMPTDATREEQSARSEADGWAEPILEKAEEWWIRYQISPVGSAITAKRVLTDAVGMPMSQINEAHCRRVAAILRSNGYERRKDKIGFIWIRRERAV